MTYDILYKTLTEAQARNTELVMENRRLHTKASEACAGWDRAQNKVADLLTTIEELRRVAKEDY